MQCPQCQAVLSAAVKFCPQCGTRVGRTCPACRETVPADGQYCSECGARLPASPEEKSSDQPLHEKNAPTFFNRGERRHITVFFSDLSNSTRLYETYDPEDVKLLLVKIIERSRKVVESYGGRVVQVVGDEILAVFGLPKVHEDDAIRAIKAARKLHAAVAEIGASYEFDFDLPITMHSGINSGLVVTDHLLRNEDECGVSGDTVNLASRLSDMAGPNEILVGQETYKQACGYFTFNRRPTTRIEGRSETIRIYTVARAKPRPNNVRRNLGLRAQLVGRKAEFEQLHEAVGRLQNRQGSVIALIGDAGTGKSRLLYEFEKAYKDQDFQWITGFAYTHTQGIPYYPLINLLRRLFTIEDTQSAEEVRLRIQKGAAKILGDTTDEIPIIENLYGLENKATESMSPEIWQQRLTGTFKRILSAIARKKPTIFCMEDLHWADPPAVNMLRNIVADFHYPAILICTFRPPFSFLAGHQLNAPMPLYHEIRLGELSYSEAQVLVESLLNAGKIPIHLQRLIRGRAEGNPFYLEELINALVDAEVLTYKDGTWLLTRDFKESDIPSTIHGVITARLDRLSAPARQVLHEAAVIGRVFLYELLQRISTFGSQLDDVLSELEQSGLIMARSLYPEMEMMFKHALIQEVTYSNLLRAERRKVHERIGWVMEALFADRLNEFYETLAMHFKRGRSLEKAIFYLIRSGNKALRRYALEESQRHFLDARQLAELQTPPTLESRELLVDVLNQWAFVYYYRGRFRDLQKLFDTYQPVVDALSDHARQGMYWAWRGWILWHRGHCEAAYHTLRRAFELGEDANALHVVAHACTWLAWTSTDTGRLDEAVYYADKALQLYADEETSDPYVYFNALAGKGYACWHRGEKNPTHDIGGRLIEFGHRHTNVRSLVLGHTARGWSYLISGDVDGAKICFDEAVRVSEDPWYARFPKLALSYGFTASGATEPAKPLLKELIDFSVANGAEFLGASAGFFQELSHMTPGNAFEKTNFLERQLEEWRRTTSWLRYVICGHLMAGTLAGLVQRSEDFPAAMAQDWKAHALEKAEQWYGICKDTAAEKGMVLMQAMAWLGLAECRGMSNRQDSARQAAGRSAELFEQCGAEHFLTRAKALLM